MQLKRYLLRIGFILALGLFGLPSAMAESPWGGMYQAGGSSLLNFGMNLSNLSSAYSPSYYGGNSGSLFGCGCNSSYGSAGLGSNWGLAGGSGLDINLNLNIGLGGLGGMGGLSGISGLGGLGSLGGISGLGGLGGIGGIGIGGLGGLGGIGGIGMGGDIGCSVGMCTTGSLPLFGSYGGPGNVMISMPPSVMGGYTNIMPSWPNTWSPYGSGTGLPIYGSSPYSYTPTSFTPPTYAPSYPIYGQPPTIPWGGCDGVIVQCPSGPVTPGTYVPPVITYNPPASSIPTYPTQGPVITTHGGTSYPPVVTVPSGPSTYVPPVVNVGGGTTTPVVTVGGGTTTPVVTVGGGTGTPITSPPPTTQYVPDVQVVPENPVRYKVPRGTTAAQ